MKKATKKRYEGVFNWAVIGLMAYLIFKSLLGCLSYCYPDVLLNNFSKSYPNLTLIANANTLKQKRKELF